MGFTSIMKEFSKSSSQKKAEQQSKQNNQSTSQPIVQQQQSVQQAQQEQQTQQEQQALQEIYKKRRRMSFRSNARYVSEQGQCIDVYGNVVNATPETKGIMSLFVKYGGEVPDKFTRADISALIHYWHHGGNIEMNEFTTAYRSTNRNYSFRIAEHRPYVKYGAECLQAAAVQQLYKREKFKLYRGDRTSSFFNKIGLEYNEYNIRNLGSVLKGRWVDAYYEQFVSTTSLLNRAEAYAGQNRQDIGLIWVLDASNGVRALRADVGGGNPYAGDAEYILPLGTYLSVTDVKFNDKTYKLYIHAKIINKDVVSKYI